MARTAIHPGEHLAEQLAALHMSAVELARQLKVPTNRITHIINGERAVTGDTALRLAHFSGNTAEFWLNLQKNCVSYGLLKKNLVRSLRLCRSLVCVRQSHVLRRHERRELIIFEKSSLFEK